ncbi:MAG: hypothetical protein M1828_003383 [Chrysothrix sp. TS-e1954]|nr:MAG: hypothetical protein M1828_003383 [Chrysothrix sp. TS-e1954]
MTAGLHAYHPWGVFFALLGVFFLSGTSVTKIKQAQKANITTSATGGSSVSDTSHPRTATQVMANSLVATVFILFHRYVMFERLSAAPSFLIAHSTEVCLPYPTVTPNSASYPNLWIALGNLAPYAIIAAYAAAAADTFSSELGILSSEEPILVTSLFKGRMQRVPKGTNGGVTVVGILSGLLGSSIIGFITAFGLPMCDGSSDETEKRAAFVNVYSLDRLDQKAKRWTLQDRMVFAGIIALWGALGSIIDSLLGAWLQASVVEVRTGRVIEGDGGRKVLVVQSGDKKGDNQKARKILVGQDILSNNGVNLVTGLVMSIGALLAMVMWLGGPTAMTTGAGVEPITQPMVTSKSVP